MSNVPGIDDLKKKRRKRVIVWLFGLTCLILADEYIKEGYVFNVRDVLIPGTHEFFVVVLVVVGILLGFLPGKR